MDGYIEATDGYPEVMEMERHPVKSTTDIQALHKRVMQLEMQLFEQFVEHTSTALRARQRMLAGPRKVRNGLVLLAKARVEVETKEH
jgi:hypothetical protein